jgi:hypothetical protein
LLETSVLLLESQQILGSDDCNAGEDNGKLPLFCSLQNKLDSSTQSRNVEKMAGNVGLTLVTRPSKSLITLTHRLAHDVRSRV